MFARGVEYAASTAPNRDAEVIELGLLLPRWQVAALETAARNRGLTTAQMIRLALAQAVSDASPQAS